MCIPAFKKTTLLTLVLMVLLAFPLAALAQVNTPPVANAGEDQTIFLGQAADLSGSGTDPDGDDITDWLWTIESSPAGSSPYLSDPNSPTPFLAPDILGDYVLSLKVSDGTDWSAPDLITISVVENQPPVAVAEADVTSGVVPLTVHFDGSGSYDPEGSSLTYLWFFGDGSSTSHEMSPTHTYEFYGVFGVQLIVTDDFGQRDDETITITVNPPGNTPPEASPTATPNSGAAPLTVAFAANAFDADGDELTYAWDFGDPTSADNTSTEENPSHTYDNPGTYVAWLTVSDGELEVTESLTITVSSPIELSVARADVVFRRCTSSMGTVEMAADFSAPMPCASDQVAVYFDGIRLFDVPFSHFRQGLLNPDAYNYISLTTFVRINFATKKIIVIRWCLNLSALDNANGVDVELMMGDDTAVENILMEQVTCRKLRYIRSD